jgi:hypothetical protein
MPPQSRTPQACEVSRFVNRGYRSLGSLNPRLISLHPSGVLILLFVSGYESGLPFRSRKDETSSIHMKETKAPVVLTVESLEPKDRMEAIEGIQRGLESLRRNAGKPAEKFFHEFFNEQGIPEE